MTSKTSSDLINRKLVTPLERRRAAFAAILKPRPLSAFNVPVNTGPLNVRRATGINASV